MSSKSGETLPPTAPNSQQQSIPQRLPNDASYPADVSDSIQEENQLHLCRVDLVIVVQVFIKNTIQLKEKTDLKYVNYPTVECLVGNNMARVTVFKKIQKGFLHTLHGLATVLAYTWCRLAENEK